MDTLNLPVQADLNYNFESTSKNVEFEDSVITNRINTAFRQRVKANVSFSQYVSDFRPIETFLLNHLAEPFIWNSIVYICSGYSITYLGGYRANFDFQFVYCPNY
jgi:hypothetical protein